MQLFVIAAFCGLASSLAVPGNDVNKGSHNQIYTPPSVTVPGTGPWLGYPPGSVPSQLSFYMCCQSSPATPGIDHFYPPYACIFGPATGECPQGSRSSFPYAWLCVYQPGAVGNLVSTINRVNGRN